MLILISVAIKLNVGVKRLDEDARRRNPIKLLNSPSNRETINKVFGCHQIKFLSARLARPNEDKSIEMWVWCQTEDSLKVLNRDLAAPQALLKKLVTAFEVLGIIQSGLLGMFSSSGKPVSVTVDQNQFSGMFCKCLFFIQNSNNDCFCHKNIFNVASNFTLSP